MQHSRARNIEKAHFFVLARVRLQSTPLATPVLILRGTPDFLWATAVQSGGRPPAGWPVELVVEGSSLRLAALRGIADVVGMAVRLHTVGTPF